MIMISISEDPMLVRGLDYYSHTTFELQTMEDKDKMQFWQYRQVDSMISRDIPG